MEKTHVITRETFGEWFFLPIFITNTWQQPARGFHPSTAPISPFTEDRRTFRKASGFSQIAQLREGSGLRTFGFGAPCACCFIHPPAARREGGNPCVTLPGPFLPARPGLASLPNSDVPLFFPHL